MARRAKTDREAAAPDKTLTSALGQSLDQVAAEIAEKAAEKLADKLTAALMEKVTCSLVENIAQGVLEKLAGKLLQHQSAGLKPDDTTAAFPGEGLSSIPSAKVGGDTRGASAEAVICVSTQSPADASEQDLDHAGGKAEAKPAPVASAPDSDAEPSRVSEELAKADPAAASASAAGAGKRRSPEAEAAPPQKKAKTVDDVAPRRNPARAANEAAENAPGRRAQISQDLLTEALKPLTPGEITAWQGWAELESEPAFFNYIVKKLGVKDVTIKELLSLESWALGLLPKPVFGLVFLFQYTPQLEDEEEDNAGDAPVWFANQTTANSCASVALLNTIMNADHIELGDQLQAFKESTKDLSSPLRGRRIGANGFIRTAHNSFVRRIDVLEADLSLSNEVSDSSKPKRPKKAAPRRKQAAAASARGAKKAAADVGSQEFGFHFIAYVPANGIVWELDGMRAHPRNVGLLDSQDWTAVAAPRIQQRIQDYGSSANGFSLLAMCRSPLNTQRAAIASHLSAVRCLKGQFQGDAAFDQGVSAAHYDVLDNEEALAEFGLEQHHVADAEFPEFVKERMSRPDLDATQARGLYEQLVAGIKFAVAKYRDEAVAVSEDHKRVEERQKDYTPALHSWMSKLADKGVLEDIIRSSR